MKKYIVHIRAEKTDEDHFLQFDKAKDIRKWFSTTSIHEKVKEEGVTIAVYSISPLLTQTLSENNEK